MSEGSVGFSIARPSPGPVSATAGALLRRDARAVARDAVHALAAAGAEAVGAGRVPVGDVLVPALHALARGGVRLARLALVVHPARTLPRRWSATGLSRRGSSPPSTTVISRRSWTASPRTS